MKKVFLSFLLCSCFLVISVVLWTGKAYAPPPGCAPVANNLAICRNDLDTCDGNLTTCNADLAACEAGAQVFPGDGYGNPDSFGVSGHGPALSYTNNLDGTFTDNNTKFMWEIKDNNGGIHDADNAYTWTDGGDGDFTNPDGTLFTSFLNTLNNTCQNDESIDCSTNGDADCTGVGGVCGFAGYRDWCIPSVKRLQSIVDYSTVIPASSVPGSIAIAASFYWSATTDAGGPGFAWFVGFNDGDVGNGFKGLDGRARAVRPCP